MLADIALLGAETARTLQYLKALTEAGLLPQRAVILRRRGGDANVGIAALCRDGKIDVTVVEAEEVNDPAVVDAVAALTASYVIFSGPAGAIVRSPLFDTGKRFIHVHPGRLPQFRGSTTIYYSLLAEDAVAATAIILAPDIDTGPVIGAANFSPPTDRRTIDTTYDAEIRSKLLVKVLGDYSRTGCFEERDQPAGGETYYIIHPVLKHIAILGSRNAAENQDV